MSISQYVRPSVCRYVGLYLFSLLFFLQKLMAHLQQNVMEIFTSKQTCAYCTRGVPKLMSLPTFFLNVRSVVILLFFVLQNTLHLHVRTFSGGQSNFESTVHCPE